MTIRRINYTKRRRIDKQDVIIRLAEPMTSPPTATVRVDLSKHDTLPDDASIYIEAYRQTTRMRFSFGTVKHPGFPSGRAVLTEFPDAEALQFAVKVTGVSGEAKGMLLADRDGIPPTTSGSDASRETILPTCSADIGQELWRLDFQASGVTLLINTRIQDWKSFASSAEFKAIAYPSIVRQVLGRVLIVEDWDDAEDDDDWRSKWLKFAGASSGLEVPDFAPHDISGRWEWIEDVTAAFSSRSLFATNYANT